MPFGGGAHEACDGRPIGLADPTQRELGHGDQQARRRPLARARSARLPGALRPPASGPTHTTAAATTCPHSASGTPTTHAARTPGCAARTRSTAAGATFSPPVTITSSARPSTSSRPSRHRPRSPVRKRPPANADPTPVPPPAVPRASAPGRRPPRRHPRCRRPCRRLCGRCLRRCRLGRRRPRRRPGRRCPRRCPPHRRVPWRRRHRRAGSPTPAWGRRARSGRPHRADRDPVERHAVVDAAAGRLAHAVGGDDPHTGGPARARVGVVRRPADQHPVEAAQRVDAPSATRSRRAASARGGVVPPGRSSTAAPRRTPGRKPRAGPADRRGARQQRAHQHLHPGDVLGGQREQPGGRPAEARLGGLRRRPQRRGRQPRDGARRSSRTSRRPRAVARAARRRSPAGRPPGGRTAGRRRAPRPARRPGRRRLGRPDHSKKAHPDRPQRRRQ